MQTYRTNTLDSLNELLICSNAYILQLFIIARADNAFFKKRAARHFTIDSTVLITNNTNSKTAVTRVTYQQSIIYIPSKTNKQKI